MFSLLLRLPLRFGIFAEPPSLTTYRNSSSFFLLSCTQAHIKCGAGAVQNGVAPLATQNQARSSRSPLRRLGLPGQPAGLLSAGPQPALADSALPPGAAAAPSVRANVVVYGAAAFPVYAPEQLRSRRACAQNDPTRFVRDTPYTSYILGCSKGARRARTYASTHFPLPIAVFWQGRHWTKPWTHAQEAAARTVQGDNQ